MGRPHMAVYELILGNDKRHATLMARTHYLNGPQSKNNNHKRRICGNTPEKREKLWREWRTFLQSGKYELQQGYSASGKRKLEATIIWED